MVDGEVSGTWTVIDTYDVGDLAPAQYPELGSFASSEEASEFIAGLPGHESGRYGICGYPNEGASVPTTSDEAVRMRKRMRLVQAGEEAIHNLVLVQFSDGEEVRIAGTKQELREMLDRAGKVVDALP